MNKAIEESTPEKAWALGAPEIDPRQSRSKSRNRVTQNNFGNGGGNSSNSERKRALTTNISLQNPGGPPTNPGNPTGNRLPKSAHPTRKTPGGTGRAGTSQSGRQYPSDTDYNALHEDLITEILKEEEEVLNQHKEHIDTMYKSSKVEAKMIQEVDKPGSEITTYIEGLSTLLVQHLQDVKTLQSRLYSFKEKLKEEHRLSKICLSQNEGMDYQDEGVEYGIPGEITDYQDEPRSRAPRVQSGYDYPPPRNSNYQV